MPSCLKTLSKLLSNKSLIKYKYAQLLNNQINYKCSMLFESK